jgi:predicted nicotinamide N-methyase
MIKGIGEKPYSDRLPGHDFLARFAPVKPVEGCGGIVAHQADDLFALWEAWERACGGECPTPYWASVWPAAVVLARYILSHPDLVLGRTVLDLGCGGGVAGIAAARAGASRVIANDIDPIALEIAIKNFAANGVCIEICASNLVDSKDRLSVDLIMVGDLFYHRAAANSLSAFLRSARKNGTQVLIADGNRPFTPVTGITLISQETVPVSMELEGVPCREVKLLALVNE